MTLILSGTNGVSDIDGDASTPALRGTDANSGVFFGSDVVGVSTGGSEKVSVGASALVINDGGADFDFRVEGDTDANLLFVDASTDRVGIGKSNPGSLFDVAGTVTADAFIKDSQTSLFKIVDFGGASTEIAVESGGQLSITTEGLNPIEFNTNDTKRTAISGTGVFTHEKSAIFNEEGGDNDFRVEGDTSTHLLFVDASTDRVGIGASSPAFSLDVVGNIRANKSIASGSLTGGVAANFIPYSEVLTNTTLASGMIFIVVSGTNTVDGGFCGYYLLHLLKAFSTYTVTVIASGLPHNNSGYGFTFTLDANYLKVNPSKTCSINYNYFVLTGSQTS